MMFCASCGTAGGNGIKLKDCSACHLVKYCDIECQKEHRPRHKKECKKRAAELRDEILFKQPKSTHLGDCPICCLPLPIDTTESKSILMGCCSKIICDGCNIANQKREMEGRLQHTCPFCRKPAPETDEDKIEQLMKRIKANDPFAIRFMAMERYRGGDYKSAFEYSARAAALGDVEAHYQLSIFYRYGKGVEKDENRALHHTEQAAIGGHPNARHNLGSFEGTKDRVDRAVKHYIIATKLGLGNSLHALKTIYKAGHVRKEDFAAALRGHKAAVDATKSPQREEAGKLRQAAQKGGGV